MPTTCYSSGRSNRTRGRFSPSARPGDSTDLNAWHQVSTSLHIASAECNNNLRALLTGLEGIVQIQDDIVVHGLGKQHDERLTKVLERPDAEGFTLCRDKCVFGQPEIAWFGKVYGKTGVSIDPNKSRLIREMPTPTTKEETVSFLQMAQFNLEFLHPSQLQNTATSNQTASSLQLDTRMPPSI